MERLGEADLADCLALSAAAGWNQVAADWRLFLGEGLVWGVRAGREATVLASAALLPFPPDAAWIAMVLTLPAARGRGLATRLMAEAIAEAERRGLPPSLDATPAGEPVYRRLGFADGPALMRWRRPGAAPARPSPAARAAPGLEEIAARDGAASGLRRRTVLASLLARGPVAVTPRAFGLSRDGRTAWQVGPVVAEDDGAAAEALGAVVAALPPGDAVVVDLLEGHAAAERALRRGGFVPERPFRRMSLGRPPATDRARYVAAAGPEFG